MKLSGRNFGLRNSDRKRTRDEVEEISNYISKPPCDTEILPSSRPSMETFCHGKSLAATHDGVEALLEIKDLAACNCESVAA